MNEINYDMSPASLRRYLAVGLLTIFLILPAWSKDFVITDAKASFNDTALAVDATFDLQLNDAIDEALHNGINIRLTTTLDLFKQNRYRWNSRIARWSFNHDIHYHSLTNRYALTDPQKGESQSYSSLGELFNNIESFHFQSDIHSQTLPASKHGYILKLNIVLNKASLPAPLRVMTYVLPSWRLKSDVHEWHVDG